MSGRRFHYLRQVTIYDTMKDVLWLQRLLAEIRGKQDDPTILFCDNTAAQQLS